MKPQAGLLGLGLLVQAILSFPLCAGRPHAHAHSHEGRIRHATENYTASSGSSLIFHSTAVAWGEISSVHTAVSLTNNTCKVLSKLRLISLQRPAHRIALVIWSSTQRYIFHSAMSSLHVRRTMPHRTLWEI